MPPLFAAQEDQRKDTSRLCSHDCVSVNALPCDRIIYLHVVHSAALEAVMSGTANIEGCVPPTNRQTPTALDSTLQIENDDVNDAQEARGTSVTNSDLGSASPPLADGADRQRRQWNPPRGIDLMVGVVDSSNDFPLSSMEQVPMPDYFSYNLDLDNNHISSQASDFIDLCGMSSTASVPFSRSSMTNQTSSWQFGSSLPISPTLTPTGQEAVQLSALVKADL